MESEASKSSTMAKLKLAGACSCILEVESEVWTIPMLREEVAKRSNCEPKSIKLICAGKVLKDGDGNEKLNQLGIKNNAKILATRASTDQGNSLNNELMAEEERSTRISRIKAAAVALSKRHAAGSLPVEDYNLEVEDQSGQKVELGSETDQRGVMMGLMLHANARHFIKRQQYKDALDVLAMGEEAFSLCDPAVLKMIDNVPILEIDTVWCYFMLRDMTWLSMAGVRLAKAREGIERAYGKDLIRARTLQRGRQPELAVYLRLELLEGVMAYHINQYEKSRKALTSAQAKYLQLQVSDEALSLLMSMGYKEEEAKRALRMNNQDVARAIDFLVEEKEKKAQREMDDVQRRQEIREQKRYGMTPLKKAVDLHKLYELVSIGFEKVLAAEALRRNENDREKALDDLTNPETNSEIQLYLDSRKRKRASQAKNNAMEALLSMGYERSRVVGVLQSFPTLDEAIRALTQESGPNPSVAEQESAASASADSEQENTVAEVPEVDAMEGPSSVDEVEERDTEMEEAIAHELTGDPLSDYDIEITKEGEAITEYLALLASTGNN